MANFLQVAPNKLVMCFSLGEQSTCNITLQNPTDERVAFKVKTTAPAKYSVKPASGVLEAHGDARLVVTMAAPRQAPPSLADCKDRFLVEALTVGPEVAAATSELFKSRFADVSGTKLKVVLMESKTGGSSSGTAAAKAAGMTPADAPKPASASTPRLPASGTAGGSAGKRQQQQDRVATPATAAAGGKAGTKASPAAADLQLLPGASRLAKASPAAPAPLAQVPADVLAAFAGVAPAVAAPSREPSPAAAGGEQPAAAGGAAAAASAPAPTAAALVRPEVPPAAKFSSSLQKRMAKLQQQQQQQQGQPKQAQEHAPGGEAKPAALPLAAAALPKQAAHAAAAAQPAPPVKAAATAAAAAGAGTGEGIATATAGQADPRASKEMAAAASHEAAAPHEAAAAARGKAAPAPDQGAAGGTSESALDGQQYVGRAVRKKFKGRYYTGTVLEYAPEERWWLIKYEDSDEEDVDFKELQRILVSHPKPDKAAKAKRTQQTQQAGQQQEALQLAAAQAEAAATSPPHSAVVSHHTELAAAGQQDTAATCAHTGGTAGIASNQPTAGAHAVAAALAPSRATTRKPTRGARMEDVLSVHSVQARAQHAQQRLQQQAAKKRADVAPQPVREPEPSATKATAPAEQASPTSSTSSDDMPVLQTAAKERRRHQDISSANSSEDSGEAPARQDSQAADRGGKTAAPRAAAAASAPAAGHGKARQGGDDGDDEEEETAVDLEEEEEGAEEEGYSSEGEGGDEPGADSDPDFELDDGELLPEEQEEARWMAEQRRLRGLSASPPLGSPGGGGTSMRPRRRRSSAAAAAVPAVAVKQERVAVVKQERQGIQRQPSGDSDVLDLTGDDDIDDSSGAPAVVQASKRRSEPGPRTKRAAAAGVRPTLCLSFCVDPTADSGRGTGQPRPLAVMRVHGSTVVSSVQAALAARCLEGGGEGSSGALVLRRGGGDVPPLAPELSVRAAGLQDGDQVFVSIAAH